MVFSENSSKYLDNFSREFESEFITLLSRRWGAFAVAPYGNNFLLLIYRFGTTRVMANLVYQEYISDKQHVHMNATKWSSLTEFVKYLGKEGKCEVEDTEKGWFIRWIDRRPETLARKEAELRKARAERDEEERQAKLLEEQIERAKQQAGGQETQATELIRDNEDEKVKVQLKPLTMAKPAIAPPKKLNALAAASKKAAVTSTAERNELKGSNAVPSSTLSVPRKLTAVEEIMMQEQKKKARYEDSKASFPHSEPRSSYRHDREGEERRGRSRSPDRRDSEGQKRPVEGYGQKRESGRGRSRSRDRSRDRDRGERTRDRA